MRVPARHIYVCCLPRIETEITGRSVAFFRRASSEVLNRTPASGSDVRAWFDVRVWFVDQLRIRDIALAQLMSCWIIFPSFTVGRSRRPW